MSANGDSGKSGRSIDLVLLLWAAGVFAAFAWSHVDFGQRVLGALAR